MGYYTRYKLSVEAGKQLTAAVERHINDDEDGYLNCAYNHDDSDTMKWYDWEQDMRTLSGKFPGVLFQLDGEGEESGDVWRAHFYDGKMQHQTLEPRWDEFDVEKLT